MTKAPFRFLKFLFTISIGAVYGMLFAQKTGKELRKELKTSNSPLSTLLKEGIAVDTEAIQALVGEAKKSEEIQTVIKKMNGYLGQIGIQAEDLSKEGLHKAQAEMEHLSITAKKMADKLRVKFEQVKKEAQKVAKEEINKFKHPSNSDEV